MNKVVILKLQGDWDKIGFHVTLEIDKNHPASPSIPPQRICEQVGYLPPNPQLRELLEQHWFERYRELVAPYRKIQPQQVILISSRDVQESAESLRESLNRWLTHESFINISNRLRESLQREDKIQFIIRTNNTDIQKVPWREWNLIRDGYPQSEVAFSPINYTAKPTQNSPQNPLTILAILGHSQGIDVDQDRQFLQGLSWAKVTFLVEPSRRQINDQLWNHAWDIIFFAGHSETEGEQGKIYINPTESLTIDQLWFGLKRAVNRGLKLTIFNSCDGLGLTRKLDDLKIPQMIVMRELVPDQVAQEFLKYLLEGLANHRSLSLAFREARERLQGLENEYPCASWLPVIYQYHPEVEDIILPHKLISPVTLENASSPTISLSQALLISTISTLFVMILRYFGALEYTELKAFDQLMVLRPRHSQPDPRLLLIEITENDIDSDQIESISDQNLEKLLQQINQFEQKPAVIGLDIYRTHSIDSGQFPDLYHQFKNNLSFVTICKQGNEKDIDPPPDIETEQQQGRVGFNNSPVDRDGIIRRHIIHQEPWSRSGLCKSKWSFASLIALQYIHKNSNLLSKNTDSFDFKFDSNEEYFPTFQENIGNGGYQSKQPKGRFRGYQTLFNYQPLHSINQIAETLTLGEVIHQNKLTAEQVKDRIILIGTTARSEEDYHRTPYTSGFDRNTPGIIIKAHIISYLLRVIIDGELALRWFPGWIEWLWIGIWSIGGSLLYWRFRSGIVMGIIIISLGGICYFILLFSHVWVPLIPPLLALMISTLSLSKANQIFRIASSSQTEAVG